MWVVGRVRSMIGRQLTPDLRKSSSTKSFSASSPSTVEKATSAPFNKEDFKNDPLIQKALEIFKGQIVEVHS